MGDIFETIMVICFGVSWPVSIYKSIKSKTAKGKSLVFLICIFIGYLCGIVSKVLIGIESGKISYVLYFYILNAIMVFIDLILYFNNKKYDILDNTSES